MRTVDGHALLSTGPRGLRALMGLCLIVGSFSIAWGAPPKLNYLFPPGGQRGQTVEVTANGSWDNWPVTAWSNRPGLQVSAGSDKGKLQINVDANAQPGVVWLRLVNQDGATALKPFVVGSLPEINEQEPNNDPNKPQSLSGSTTVNGRLGKREDVDTFSIQLTKGQTLVASLQANKELASAVDGVLQICSADRFVYEQGDDARGVDPMIAFSAPSDGVYLVRAFGFPATPDSSIAFAGNDAYVYRLTITTGGFVDHTLPMSVTRGMSSEVRLIGWNIPESAARLTIPPADGDVVLVSSGDVSNAIQLPVVSHPSIAELSDSQSSEPQRILIPSVLTGVIERPKDEDVFTFSAKKGEQIVFDVESDELGFLLHGVLTVSDSGGKVLSEADGSRRARDPQLTFSPPADGEFRCTLRDAYGHGGTRFVYRLTAQLAKPDFELKLSADTFSVKPGESVEVSVAVDRGKGFDQEIEVSGLGLPTGVTATPVKSQKDGDTAKAVKLVLQASADAQSGPFQVLGKTSGDSPREKRARLSGDGIPAEVSHAWLSIAK